MDAAVACYGVAERADTAHSMHLVDARRARPAVAPTASPMHNAVDQASIVQLLRHVGVAWSREGLPAGEHHPGIVNNDLRTPANRAG